MKKALISGITGQDGSFLAELPSDTASRPARNRKLLDVSRLSALGWKARIGLEQGIAATYSW